MKRHLTIIIGLLLLATALLSFGLLTNNDDKPMKNDYETLWKRFEEKLDDDLPESAEKVLNEIEKKAEKDKWRVPESTLIMLAVLGGSAGALAGMLVFRHKTKKAKFMIGIPVILLLQVLLVSFILMNR